jgi:hypothetical protein
MSRENPVQEVKQSFTALEAKNEDNYQVDGCAQGRCITPSSRVFDGLQLTLRSMFFSRQLILNSVELYLPRQLIRPGVACIQWFTASVVKTPKNDNLLL